VYFLPFFAILQKKPLDVEFNGGWRLQNVPTKSYFPTNMQQKIA